VADHPDHIAHAATLAAEIADVLTELETPADVAADLSLAEWAMADQIVRLRRMQQGRLSPGEAEALSRPGWSHVPGDGTRLAAIDILRARQVRATCRRRTP
jgi:hypothetical protein